MIKKYIQQYWSKATVLIALLATGWYLYHLYNQAYAPLFITPIPNSVTSSRYNIPRGTIDHVLQTKANKSLETIDFSSVTTSISAKSPADLTIAGDSNATVGSEGITVNETTP